MSGAFGQPKAAPLLVNTVISRNKNECFATHFKVIGAGKNIEVYTYSKPIFVNHQGNSKKLIIPSDDEVLDILTNPDKYQPSDRSAEYKQRNINKAKNRIRRLVQANFDKVGKFLTFTFKNTSDFDIASLSACHSKFYQFMKLLRVRYGEFKYVSVPEFQ